jgi:hypothetical protein
MEGTFHGYRVLRSGGLSLLYNKAEIRRICLGEVEVLNAIYAAVRDQNWTTLPFSLEEERIEESENALKITLQLAYAQEEICFRARMSLEAQGHALRVDYEGEALGSFLRNRIGLCILHPLKECQGKPVLIHHPDGSHSEDRFPELISPDQPFFNVSGMRWEPAKGVVASLRFAGEIFETEDQRNWTDASYKTYGTPLDRPFPVRVQKADKVSQSVTLQVEPDAERDRQAKAGLSHSTGHNPRILTFQANKSRPIPALGTGRSTEKDPLTQAGSEILNRLPFQHYRVDLRLDRQEWKETYHAAAREQKLLGWPLELVLHFGRQAGVELDNFLKQFHEKPLDIKHILLFDQQYLSPATLLDLVLPPLRKALPGIALGGGSDANYAELNRFPPDPDLLDFISYSICPQIHAFDNLTLLENLEAQGQSAINAKNQLGKPVHIHALTLKRRFNAVATEQEEGNQASPETDPRQHTPFAAAWTLGSIRHLALAGAASVTCFETVGPRGILHHPDSGSARPPLFYLFEDFPGLKAWRMIPTKSSHPLEFESLALQGEKEGLLFLANYLDRTLNIHLADLPGKPGAIDMLTPRGWKRPDMPAPGPPDLSLPPLGICKITYVL